MDGKCPKCGAVVQEGHKFCPKCGAPMEAPPPPAAQPKFCQKCGAPLAEGVKFCKKCGHPTTGTVAAGQTAQYVSPPTNNVGNGATVQPHSSGMNSKVIIGIICAVIAVLCIIGLSGGTKKDVRAEEIVSSYIQNPVKADKEYKNKSVKVSGKVLRKGQFNNSSNFSICLDHEQDQGNDYTLIIDIPNDKIDEVNKIQKNDFINVEGTCLGRVPQNDRTDISIQVQADKVRR